MLYLRFVFFLISSVSVAQIGGGSTFSFLNLESSPRINSLGGYTPIVIDDDPNLALFNPSLINASMNSFVSLNYVNYYADINYGSIAFMPKISSKFQILSGIKYVDYGFFEETDEFGNIIGQFNASEYLFSLGSSKVLFNGGNNLFNIGLSTKLALSQLYTDFSLAFLIDFSLLYVNSHKRINTSLLVRNFGYQLIKYNNGNLENLPFELLFSISNKLEHMPLRWTLSFQHLENWNLNFENLNQSEEILTEDKANFGEEFMRHIVLGLEFLITKNLNFRLGYNNRNRNEMMILDRKAMVGFSYGFSFKLNRFKFNYGRSLNHFSGPVNSLGITTNISSF